MINKNVAETITAQNSQRNQSNVEYKVKEVNPSNCSKDFKVTEKFKDAVADTGYRLFEVFSDGEVKRIGEMLGNRETDGSSKLRVDSSFIINYLKKADYCLRKARMSEPDKALIRGTVQLLASFIPFKKEEYWRHMAEAHYPSELETEIEMVSNGESEAFDSLEEIGEQAIEEIGFILSDFQNEDVTYCNPADALDVIQEYVDVINECEVEVPEWVISEIEKVLGDC